LNETLLQAANRLEEAEPLVRRALAIDEQLVAHHRGKLQASAGAPTLPDGRLEWTPEPQPPTSGELSAA